MPSGNSPPSKLSGLEITIIVAVGVLAFAFIMSVSSSMKYVLLFAAAMIAAIYYFGRRSTSQTAALSQPQSTGTTFGDPLMYARELTDSERMLFMSEFTRVSKNVGTARLLAVLLPAGTHWFYLGNSTRGLLYLLFVWTFVPILLSLVDAFGMKEIVDKYNTEQAMRIKNQLLEMRMQPGTTPTTVPTPQ